MGELSWKAVRRGAIYCAPACGGNCTWEQYLAAKRRGERSAKELGKGWTVRVHENLGWHVSVISPCRRIKVSVSPVHGTPGETLIGTLDSYMAFFGEPDSPGGRWSEGGDTPREAVNAVIAKAQTELEELQAHFTGLTYWNG